MYCRKCGKEIPDDSNVCPYCGVEVITTNNYPVYNKTNTMAIVGLITAFLSPLLGWIFGGIGLKRANAGYGGKWTSIFALIIATANFAFSVYMVTTGRLDDYFNRLLNQ